MNGVASNPMTAFGPTGANMDWVHNLLPPGGKVSITVAHPTTGLTSVANGATPGPAGPNNIPPPQVLNPPKPGAPGAPATPVAPHDTNPNDGNWWNPYSGKQEAIPGV